MSSDFIARIEIDATGRLCVTPSSVTFDHIYRAAMEVHWDNDGRFLYSPKPREWSYADWFKQIVAAAKDEYGCDLKITNSTEWKEIPLDLKDQLLNIWAERGHSA